MEVLYLLAPVSFILYQLPQQLTAWALAVRHLRLVFGIFFIKRFGVDDDSSVHLLR